MDRNVPNVLGMTCTSHWMFYKFVSDIKWIAAIRHDSATKVENCIKIVDFWSAVKYSRLILQMSEWLAELSLRPNIRYVHILLTGSAQRALTTKKTVKDVHACQILLLMISVISLIVLLQLSTKLCAHFPCLQETSLTSTGNFYTISIQNGDLNSWPTTFLQQSDLSVTVGFRSLNIFCNGDRQIIAASCYL